MDKILEKFRGKLNNGEFVYGVFTKSSDPMIAEIQGISNFDFIILDTEHGQLNVSMEQNNIRSSLLQNILPIVRVNEISEGTISKAFELGALGVMVPEIETAEAAKEAIGYARFYPYGNRGVCRFVRAAQYSAMDRKRYFEESKNLLMILQLEGTKAIENIDEILDVPGIDIIFIGPYDLSASLGVPGEIKNPKVLDSMIGIVEKAKAKGITIGTFTDDFEMVEKWKKLGVQYISYSTDAGMFYDKCRDTYNALSICGEKTIKGKILDSTLRSGGSVNDYEFGLKNIKTIIHSLEDSKVDFIECGTLAEEDNSNSTTKFSSIEEINKLVGKKASGNYVTYFEFGKYNIDLVKEYPGYGVKFIKLAFHKKNIVDALIVAKKLKNKGYNVMLEPKNTIIYTDMEFEYLIKEVNQLKPYAVYLSDSFGTMKRKDVIHFYTILERLLDNDIYPAFHAHNNLQLAFANAITILDSSNREFIIDSAIYGMGRSAGNLNTELIVKYLNDNFNGEYKLNPIINVMDSVISKAYNKYEWGYSLPDYLSANYNLNPSYASFLIDKNNLTFKEMHSIFQMIDDDKKDEFDQVYIESLYLTFLKSKTIDENGYKDLVELLKDKDVVVVAPGKSANNYMDEINESKKNGSKIISINFNFNDKLVDYIFVGNIKRMNQLDEEDHNKIIATSNIPAETVFARVNYTKLLNEQDGVEDNSGLMLIKMLVSIGCKSITVYGMDGYTYNIADNYSKNELQLLSSKEQIDRLNFGLKVMKKEFKESYNVKFKGSIPN